MSFLCITLISEQRGGCRNISVIGCHRSLSAGGAETCRSVHSLSRVTEAMINPYKGFDVQRLSDSLVPLSLLHHSSISLKQHTALFELLTIPICT